MTVQVAPGCVVYHDGETYQAGDVITVPATDAAKLHDQGIIEDTE